MWLQTVELVERVIPDRVADKVEYIFRPRRRIALSLVCEGAAAGEAVVAFSDEAGI